MTIHQQIFTLYKDFYAQRSVLTKAPLLTISMENATMETFDFEKATQELDKLVAYLLGVSNVAAFSLPKLIEIIEKEYGQQPFWKKLLLNYASILVDKQEETLNEERKALLEETTSVLQEIDEMNESRNRTIKQILDKMAPFNFAINGQKLLETFFKMLLKDPVKACETLRTNPAFFSPILQETDGGKRKLSPAETKKENERIADFFKNYNFQ